MDKDQRAEGREVPEVWLVDTWDGGVNLSHVREDYVKARRQFKFKAASEIGAVTVAMFVTLLSERGIAFSKGMLWRPWLYDILSISAFALALTCLTYFLYFLRGRDSSRVSRLKEEMTSAYSAALISSPINPDRARELHA
jgi:phosphatidylglycerophosphate synthase